jgi:hypothetical protein
VTDAAGTHTFTQPLVVRMDPRVRTPAAILARQHALSRQLADAMGRSAAALREVRTARGALGERRKQASGAVGDSLTRLDANIGKFEGAGARGGPPGGAAAGETFGRLADDLASIYEILQSADVAPSAQAVDAAQARLRALDALLTEWKTARARQLGSAERLLRGAGLAPLDLAAAARRIDWRVPVTAAGDDEP